MQEALKALADGKARLLRISPALQHSAVPQEGVYDFVMTCASQGALEIFIVAFLPSEISPYRDAIVFILLIGFLLFRPNGLLKRSQEVKL